jgi:beta-carotene hydroxylase
MVLSFVTYGSTSHDLVHRCLGLNRRLNDILLCIVELIALRSGHAYQAAHLHHHERFPHGDDIEAEASRLSFIGALLNGITFQPRIYAWSLQYPRKNRTWIIFEGVAIVVVILGAIAALPWSIVPVAYVALMIAGSWTIPLITSYLPHNPEGADALHQTRMYRGLLVRVIAFDHLYHLEHHLYPAVPHQNWPRLARRLDPWLDAAGIKPVHIGWSSSRGVTDDQQVDEVSSLATVRADVSPISTVAIPRDDHSSR